jgi:hypothetical protein
MKKAKKRFTMWFQRVMFNLKARLLNQREIGPVESRWTPAPLAIADEQRVQAIQARLQDLDRRLAELRTR